MLANITNMEHVGVDHLKLIENWKPMFHQPQKYQNPSNQVLRRSVDVSWKTLRKTAGENMSEPEPEPLPTQCSADGTYTRIEMHVFNMESFVLACELYITIWSLAMENHRF